MKEYLFWKDSVIRKDQIVAIQIFYDYDCGGDTSFFAIVVFLKTVQQSHLLLEKFDNLKSTQEAFEAIKIALFAIQY